MLHASPSKAEPSAWLGIGGGYGLQHNARTSSFDGGGALSFSIGVGSTPIAPIVFGSILRTTTYFTLGTDMSLSLRVATGGFARGQWGAAIDFGPTWRGWGDAAVYGRFPLSAMLIGGAPWGLQAGIGTQLFDIGGYDSARGVVALFEVDLLRLTVMRQGSTDKYWPNPSPVGGRIHPTGSLDDVPSPPSGPAPGPGPEPRPDPSEGGPGSAPPPQGTPNPASTPGGF